MKKNKVIKIVVSCCLVVGLMTSCSDDKATFGTGSRSIAANLANKQMKFNNVRIYDYYSSKAISDMDGTYYATSGLQNGSKELEFTNASGGKRYLAKVNVLTNKIVVRYTKAGACDTYSKR